MSQNIPGDKYFRFCPPNWGGFWHNQWGPGWPSDWKAVEFLPEMSESDYFIYAEIAGEQDETTNMPEKATQ